MRNLTRWHLFTKGAISLICLCYKVGLPLCFLVTAALIIFYSIKIESASDSIEHIYLKYGKLYRNNNNSIPCLYEGEWMRMWQFLLYCYLPEQGQNFSSSDLVVTKITNHKREKVKRKGPLQQSVVHGYNAQDNLQLLYLWNSFS